MNATDDSRLVEYVLYNTAIHYNQFECTLHHETSQETPERAVYPSSDTRPPVCALCMHQKHAPPHPISHQSVFLCQAGTAFKKPGRLLAGFKKRSSRL